MGVVDVAVTPGQLASVSETGQFPAQQLERLSTYRELDYTGTRQIPSSLSVPLEDLSSASRRGCSDFPESEPRDICWRTEGKANNR